MHTKEELLRRFYPYLTEGLKKLIHGQITTEMVGNA